jgi:hypothetical protein
MRDRISRAAEAKKLRAMNDDSPADSRSKIAALSSIASRSQSPLLLNHLILSNLS